MSTWTIAPRNGREARLRREGKPEPRHHAPVPVPPCLKCGGTRFSLKRNRRLRRGLQRYCLDCQAATCRRWREANREKYQRSKRASQKRLRMASAA